LLKGSTLAALIVLILTVGRDTSNEPPQSFLCFLHRYPLYGNLFSVDKHGRPPLAFVSDDSVAASAANGKYRQEAAS
jgi:hypothetical protein